MKQQNTCNFHLSIANIYIVILIECIFDTYSRLVEPEFHLPYLLKPSPTIPVVDGGFLFLSFLQFSFLPCSFSPYSMMSCTATPKPVAIFAAVCGLQFCPLRIYDKFVFDTADNCANVVWVIPMSAMSNSTFVLLIFMLSLLP